MNGNCLNEISITENWVSKNMYRQFEKAVGELYDFLHIFKADLKNIEIDKKENHDCRMYNDTGCCRDDSFPALPPQKVYF